MNSEPCGMAVRCLYKLTTCPVSVSYFPCRGVPLVGQVPAVGTVLVGAECPPLAGPANTPPADQTARRRRSCLADTETARGTPLCILRGRLYCFVQIPTLFRRWKKLSV